MPPQSFFKRNIVAIVMLPSIVGIHWGWSLVQQNRTLVSPSEEMDLPVVLFARYCWDKLTSAQPAGGVAAAAAGVTTEAAPVGESVRATK